MALAAEVSTLHTASHIGFSVKFEIVTSCRFVFTQLLTPITSVNHKIRRIQLYTDTHYGDNLVVFNEAQLNDLEKLNGQ